jgi:hypothetical protein
LESGLCLEVYAFRTKPRCCYIPNPARIAAEVGAVKGCDPVAISYNTTRRGQTSLQATTPPRSCSGDNVRVGAHRSARNGQGVHRGFLLFIVRSEGRAAGRDARRGFFEGL